MQQSETLTSYSEIFCRDRGMAEQAAAEQSRTTHAAPAAVDACRVFARLLVRAIAGEPKRDLLMPWPDATGLDPGVAVWSRLLFSTTHAWSTKYPRSRGRSLGGWPQAATDHIEQPHLVRPAGFSLCFRA